MGQNALYTAPWGQILSFWPFWTSHWAPKGHFGVIWRLWARNLLSCKSPKYCSNGTNGRSKMAKNSKFDPIEQCTMHFGTFSRSQILVDLAGLQTPPSRYDAGHQTPPSGGPQISPKSLRASRGAHSGCSQINVNKRHIRNNSLANNGYFPFFFSIINNGKL